MQIKEVVLTGDEQAAMDHFDELVNINQWHPEAALRITRMGTKLRGEDVSDLFWAYLRSLRVWPCGHMHVSDEKAMNCPNRVIFSAAPLSWPGLR